MLFQHPRALVGTFLLLGLLAAWSASRLGFRFDFEQFFPSGDPDLEFFLEFRDRFEGDDNFLLLALPAEERFFEAAYLTRLDSLTRICQKLPHVRTVQSPTAYRYAVRSPFGLLDYPAIHLDQPERWPADSARLAGDTRVAGNLCTRDFGAGVIAMSTTDQIDYAQSAELMRELEAGLEGLGISRYHLLGRANFQSVLVDQQKREFALSAVLSGLIVFIVFVFLFRKPLGVLAGLFSVLLAMLLFLGLLGALGRPLDFMAMLYPVLMIIVGVSDVVHIFTKYQLELRKGLPPAQAMRITRREIGLATLLTSVTTAIGFLTLVTSKVPPVRHFGYSAALGVLVAYVTVIFFTTSLLSILPPDRIGELRRPDQGWHRFLTAFYRRGIGWHRLTGPALALFVGFCALGMAYITTDVRIDAGLPRRAKITEDFRYFERELSGFRPVIIAVEAAPGYRADDPAVLREMDRLEQFIDSMPQLATPLSLVTLYKSLNRAWYGDRASAYHLPERDKDWAAYRRLLDRLPDSQQESLISADGQHARITTSVLDLGTDSVRRISQALDHYVLTQTDTSVARFRQTGTGILFDKNNEYLRSSLLSGLAIAFGVIGLVMALLFRNWRMLIISFVPNLVPLLVGAAMLGALGIALDASTAIIFAIAFGIAVDDSIHFLSKFRHERALGAPLETALERCFTETGKAIFLTSIILFFGFGVLLFSATPGTVYVGLMISLTLFSAVFADLLLLPWLIRLFRRSLAPEEGPAEPAPVVPLRESPAAV